MWSDYGHFHKQILKYKHTHTHTQQQQQQQQKGDMCNIDTGNKTIKLKNRGRRGGGVLVFQFWFIKIQYVTMIQESCLIIHSSWKTKTSTTDIVFVFHSSLSLSSDPKSGAGWRLLHHLNYNKNIECHTVFNDGAGVINTPFTTEDLSHTRLLF